MTTTEVSVRLGTTINIGDFQNVRVDIEIKDYVRQNEKTSDAIDRVFDMVDAKITEKAEEYK